VSCRSFILVLCTGTGTHYLVPVPILYFRHSFVFFLESSGGCGIYINTDIPGTFRSVATLQIFASSQLVMRADAPEFVPIQHVQRDNSLSSSSEIFAQSVDRNDSNGNSKNRVKNKSNTPQSGKYDDSEYVLLKNKRMK